MEVEAAEMASKRKEAELERLQDRLATLESKLELVGQKRGARTEREKLQHAKEADASELRHIHQEKAADTGQFLNDEDVIVLQAPTGTLVAVEEGVMIDELLETVEFIEEEGELAVLQGVAPMFELDLDALAGGSEQLLPIGPGGVTHKRVGERKCSTARPAVPAWPAINDYPNDFFTSCIEVGEFGGRRTNYGNFNGDGSKKKDYYTVSRLMSAFPQATNWRAHYVRSMDMTTELQGGTRFWREGQILDWDPISSSCQSGSSAEVTLGALTVVGPDNLICGSSIDFRLKNGSSGNYGYEMNYSCTFCDGGAQGMSYFFMFEVRQQLYRPTLFILDEVVFYRTFDGDSPVACCGPYWTP